MAALRLLRAPAWQHRCSTPCWNPAPSPGRGSRRAHRPSEGLSAQLLLQPPPPPLYRQTPLTPPPPPHHLGMPLVMAATAVPHPLCPLHDLHAGGWGPLLITQGLHRAPWLPYSFPPPPAVPFCMGGGGGGLPWLPRHGPWGRGWSNSTCAAEVAAAAPCAPPPEGWG